MEQKLVIIRGVACAGKSTVAEALRPHFPRHRTAVIHTSGFYYGIVDGDKNKELVMQNTYRLVSNYLKHGYSVILEGILSFSDRHGRLYASRFVQLARIRGVPVKQLFLSAKYEELKRRESKRGRLSQKQLKRYCQLALASKRRDEIVIDTTRKSMSQVVEEVHNAIR